MFTDPSTGQIVEGIKEVSYTHDAMIDLMIATPSISQGELAKHFGYTQMWVSKIIHSDAFQAKLQERKAELVDPTIRASVEERFRTVAALSLDKLINKLADPTQICGDDFLLKTAKLAGDALGYGARSGQGAGGQTNIAVVVQVPQKATSSSEWIATHSPTGSVGTSAPACLPGIAAGVERGPIVDVQVETKRV
jgi:hypothetical protein